MVVSHACETFMMFVDRLFLARLAPELMSAAMGGGLTCFMFSTFFMGLTGYTNALVAQHVGARQPRRCPLVVSQALIVSLVAYPIILLGLPLGHALFRVMRVAPAQLAPQTVYFKILMFGTILALLRNSLSSFFSGIGQTRIVMRSAAVAMLVNVAANYILIFGKFACPPLGIAGAAIGTVLGSLAGLAILAVRYFSLPNRHAYGVLDALRFDRPMMKRLFRLGAPSGTEFFLNMLAFNLLILTFHSYGVAVAAAVTITFNWDMVSFIPLIGVSIGVTSLVGRHMGAGSPDNAHRAAMSGLKIATLYSSFTFLAFILFPEPLVRLFRPADNPAAFAEILPLAVYMVRLISVYVFADAITLVFSGALRGAGDTFWTMVISVIGHWTLTLAAFILIRLLRADPRTAWTWIVVLILGLGLMLYLRYRSGRWRSLRVLPETPPNLLMDAASFDPQSP